LNNNRDIFRGNIQYSSEEESDDILEYSEGHIEGDLNRIFNIKRRVLQEVVDVLKRH
jgi:hypothetical protein